MGSVLEVKKRRRGGWPALIAVALVGVFVGMCVSQRMAPHEDAVPVDDAARAAYVAIGGGLAMKLAALGHETREWTGSASDLASDAKAAFVMSPPADFAPENVAALLRWVEHGGTLFVAPSGCPALEAALARWVEIVPDLGEASAVAGDRMVQHEGFGWRYRELTGEERVEFDAPIEEVAFPGTMRVTSVVRESSLVLAREELGLAAEIVYGDGDIIVLPDPGMFSDVGLGLASNDAFFASLVKDWVPDGAPVWLQK